MCQGHIYKNYIKKIYLCQGHKKNKLAAEPLSHALESFLRKFVAVFLCTPAS